MPDPRTAKDRLARLAGSKNQAAYATENRSLTFRAGRARPLHRIVVGARHASPGTLESGGSAPSRSVFHGVSRAEGPSQQTKASVAPWCTGGLCFCGAGAAAQCHLNNSSGLLASWKRMTTMPGGSRERSTLFSFGVNTFSRGVEQAEHFTLIGLGIGCRLEPVPRGVDHVQHEREAELPGRKIMASCRQSHDSAHQIVGPYGREQFLLHHAFVAGSYVMQLYRSF